MLPHFPKAPVTMSDPSKKTSSSWNNAYRWANGKQPNGYNVCNIDKVVAPKWFVSCDVVRSGLLPVVFYPTRYVESCIAAPDSWPLPDCSWLSCCLTNTSASQAQLSGLGWLFKTLW